MLQATQDFGIPRKTFQREIAPVLQTLNVSSHKTCQKMVVQKRITRQMIKSAIEKRARKSAGRPTYLSRDKEALIVWVAEMKGDHSLPSTQQIIGDKLNSVLEALGKRASGTEIKTKQAYAREFICRVNKN